jgi:hypothetical protein
LPPFWGYGPYFLGKIMQGLLSPEIEIVISSETESELDPKELAKNRENCKEYWMLGPEKVNQPNSEYWRKLGNIWRISPDQAKRNLCANCEYFNDSPDMLAQMESVPEDDYDKDGGGRGFCQKFDFICHNLRTCQAWERACQPENEGEDYSNGEDHGNDKPEADVE